MWLPIYVIHFAPLWFQSPDGGEFRCGLELYKALEKAQKFQSPDGGEFRCGGAAETQPHVPLDVSVP